MAVVRLDSNKGCLVSIQAAFCEMYAGRPIRPAKHQALSGQDKRRLLHE